MKGGEIFIPKMPVIRIQDLANVLIEKFAPKFGHSPEDIGIELIGPRVGETIHEEILTEREALRTIENESMYAVLPETEIQESLLDHGGLERFEEATEIYRSTAEDRCLQYDDIVRLLEDAGVLPGHGD